MNHIKTAVGYVRVSTSNQAESGTGIQIQKSKILEHCKGKNIVFTRFYVDEGISGAVKDRPGLLSLLKDCENGSVKKIIVYKQDRLSRELTISLWLETQFKKHDIELLSVVDPEYDLEDPLQKAFKRIADIFAELEKDVIASRLKDGRVNKAQKGYRGSGAVPFGYKKTEDRLEVEPNEAKWVIKAFRLYARGDKVSKIVALFNRNGVLSKRGKPFSIQSMQYLIRNSLYYGNSTFGEIKTKGVHESIISRRLFNKAQN